MTVKQDLLKTYIQKPLLHTWEEDLARNCRAFIVPSNGINSKTHQGFKIVTVLEDPTNKQMLSVRVCSERLDPTPWSKTHSSIIYTCFGYPIRDGLRVIARATGAVPGVIHSSVTMAGKGRSGPADTLTGKPSCRVVVLSRNWVCCRSLLYVESES